MTEALIRPRSLWIAAVLGSYSALFALAPDTASRLTILAIPVLLGIAWWTLTGRPDRWLLTFLCAAVLLPPLPVALGNSGPHPSLLIAGLGLFAGLALLAHWRIPTGALARSLILLFSVLLFSVAFAALYSGIPVALGSLARVLFFGISVYVFFYVTSGPWAFDFSEAFRSTRILFLAGAASAAFACVDFYFQFPTPAGFGPQYVWLGSGVYRRAQGLFYEASTLGNFCAFFLVMIAVSLMRKEESPAGRPVLLAAATIFSAALVLSFSRASLLNVLIAGGTLIWLERRRFQVRSNGMMILAAIAVASALAYRFLPDITHHYWDRLSTSAVYLFSATEGVLSGRVASWNTLAGFLQQNPWYALLGIGYKTLPYTSLLGQPVVGDNMYLTLLVETGIAGLMAFLVLNFAILQASYRAVRSTDKRVSFFGTWIFCFWIGQMFQMLSADLFTYWRALPIYFWALAVAVRATNEHSVPGSVQ